MPLPCPACAARLETDALVCAGCGAVVRLAHAPGRAAPAGLPFQDPRTPFPRGVLRTWAAVVADPAGAFARLDAGDVLARGLALLAATALALLALNTALVAALVVERAPHVDVLVVGWLQLALPATLCQGAAALLVVPLHVACLAWGARAGGLDATLGAWCVAQGPPALLAGPALVMTVVSGPTGRLAASGLLLAAAVWLAALLTLGLRATHRAPAWRAAGAVTSAALAPPLLLHLLWATTAVS